MDNALAALWNDGPSWRWPTSNGRASKIRALWAPAIPPHSLLDASSLLHIHQVHWRRHDHFTRVIWTCQWILKQILGVGTGGWWIRPEIAGGESDGSFLSLLYLPGDLICLFQLQSERKPDTFVQKFLDIHTKTYKREKDPHYNTVSFVFISLYSNRYPYFLWRLHTGVITRRDWTIPNTLCSHACQCRSLVLTRGSSMCDSNVICLPPLIASQIFDKFGFNSSLTIKKLRIWFW